MTVKYKSLVKVNAGKPFGLAEIKFKEEERRVVERIANLMGLIGWNVDMVTDCCAKCVVEDHDAFNEFKADWKEAKMCILRHDKFGF